MKGSASSPCRTSTIGHASNTGAVTTNGAPKITRRYGACARPRHRRWARIRRVGVRVVERPHADLAPTVCGGTEGHCFLLSAHHGRTIRQSYSDRGVTYTTAAQLSSTLDRCDVHLSINMSDAYLLSLWAGRGGEPRPTKRPVIASHGPVQPNEVTWIETLVNGCDPFTCQGGCDKVLSGIMIDGLVFRFAAFRPGQMTAGSPLGCLVRAVALLRSHTGRGTRCIVGRRTSEHGPVASFEGCCPVCEEYHGRALKVQERWQEQARKLNTGISVSARLVRAARSPVSLSIP